MEKAIRESRIQYDEKGELVDVRHQRDIEGYAQWQVGNRQLNREYLEYERMKKYYAGREYEMPYKSLGSFRRARRAQTEKYQELRKNLRDILTKSKKYATINTYEVSIEVDIATPCLKEKKTGELVKTEMSTITPQQIASIDRSREYGFSWKKVLKDHPNCTIAVLKVQGSDHVEGIVAFEKVESDRAYRIYNIEKSKFNRDKNGKYAGVAKHLFAYVAKMAFENDCDCIEFKAKSSLVEYYKEVLNAKIAWRQEMYLESYEMQKLINIYYPKVKDNEKK